MDVLLECLPCVLRQALEMARLSTEDEALQEQILTEAIAVLGQYPTFGSAPEIVRSFHRILKAHTGVADPYAPIKQRDLQTALRLLPVISQKVEASEDPLYWALKAAATGNMLDAAIGLDVDEHLLDTEFAKPFAVCDLPAFRQRLQTAKSILIIGDNTGETVFDGLLLQQFPALQRTYAVRNAPALNDATAADAIASGLAPYADILPTGCDIPGVLLAECSAEFLRRFYDADIVIAKGQGNYETLSESPRGIFFLLKAKCPVMAKTLGVQLHDFVFRLGGGTQS